MAIAAPVLPVPLARFFDDLGKPLSGGLVSTYLAGTTTRTPTYKDSALTQANTNPIVLDASGQALIYLAAVTYKIDVQNAAGVSQRGYPVDNIADFGQLVAIPSGTLHGVVLGGGVSNPLSVTAVGATNTVLHGLTGADPVFSPVVEADLGFTDVTTADVSLTKHGLVPKPPNDASLYLDGTGQYSRAVSQGSMTITAVGVAALGLPTSGRGAQVIMLTNPLLATIQSIGVGFDGQSLTIVSVGTGQVDLRNQDPLSPTPAGTIITGVTGTISLAPGSGRVTLLYDASAAAGVGRWRVIHHEQGAWISPTFSAVAFTGNAAMSWTVTAANVTTLAYLLRGRTLTVSWLLTSTVVGGTVDAVLQIGNAMWGGFTAAKAMRGPLNYLDDGANETQGRSEASAATISLTKNLGLGNWTASPLGRTQVFGTLTFEVS